MMASQLNNVVRPTTHSNSMTHRPIWDPQFLSEALIIAVRKRPLLWNFKLKENKVRPQKDRAWEAVSRDLGWPEDDFLTVEKKWTNLRSTYGRHRQRQLTTPRSGSGAVATISWPFFSIMDEFLSGPDPHSTPTISNMPVSILANMDEMTRTTSVPAQTIELVTQLTQESSSNLNLDLFDDSDEDQNRPSTSFKPTKPKKPKMKSTQQFEGIQEKLLQSLQKSSAQLEKQDDVHDHFGAFVASAMRGMNKVKADLAKLEIMKVITQVECDIQIEMKVLSSHNDE